MASGFEVFLILPAGTIIYTFNHPATKELCVYNAGSLEIIQKPQFTSFKTIQGQVVDTFGVKPVVVGYQNGNYELIYAPRKGPGTGLAFRSDGSIARHSGFPVVQRSTFILMPTGESTPDPNSLTPVSLAEPSEAAIEKYIEMSQKGEEYSETRTYEQLSQPTEEPPSEPTIRSPTPKIVEYCQEKSAPIINERTWPLVEQTPLKESKEIKELQQQIDDLRGIIKVMNQRNYQIYPVECPSQLKIGDKLVSIITFNEVKQKMANKEVEKILLDPSIQAYAGSHRSNNRMLTVYMKDKGMYLVRAEYDQNTNQINPPK